MEEIYDYVLQTIMRQMLKTIPIKLFAPTANPIETFVIPEFSENDKPRFPRRHKPSFLRWFL